MKKITITILVIMLILLLGLIGYQYLNNNEEIIEDEKVEINNGVYNINHGSTEDENGIYTVDGSDVFVKLDKLNYMSDEDKNDINLPYVYKMAPKYSNETHSFESSGTTYSFDYKQFRNEFEIVEEEQVGICSVPYINLKIEGIDKINYVLKAICLNSNSNLDFDYHPYYEYYVTVKNDVLSIVIKYAGIETNTFKAYNIDLKSKKILSDEEFINKANVNEKEVEETIENYFKDSKDKINAEELAKEFFAQINDKELLFGYDIDLNKSLNDYCKYDFSQKITTYYARIVKDGCQKPDGKNYIGLRGNSILINKYLYDELNDCYCTKSYEINR